MDPTCVSADVSRRAGVHNGSRRNGRDGSSRVRASRSYRPGRGNDRRQVRDPIPANLGATTSAIAETEGGSPDREVNRYARPVLMLDEARRKYGGERLTAFIQALYQRFKADGRATTAAFLGEAEHRLGAEARERFSRTLYRKEWRDDAAEPRYVHSSRDAAFLGTAASRGSGCLLVLQPFGKQPAHDFVLRERRLYFELQESAIRKRDECATNEVRRAERLERAIVACTLACTMIGRASLDRLDWRNRDAAERDAERDGEVVHG